MRGTTTARKKGQEHQIILCDTFLFLLFAFCSPTREPLGHSIENAEYVTFHVQTKLLHDALIEFRMNIIYFPSFIWLCVCWCFFSLAVIFALVFVVCYFNELIGFWVSLCKETIRHNTALNKGMKEEPKEA